MGDDPYDFEIALPAAPSGVSRSTKNRHSDSDSDEDASDASGDLSNMSDISSEDDNEQESDREQQDRTKSNFTRTTKIANEPSSSGSALDKAKSFLSKYSSVATSNPPASSRLRVELDDDDDLSGESSSGDGETASSSKLAPTKLSSMLVTSEQDSALLQSSAWHSVHEKKSDRQEMCMNMHQSENVNGETSQNSGQSLSYATQSVPASVPAMATRDGEHSSNGSQFGDSVESFDSSASDERSEHLSAVETPMATLSKPDYHESGDAYDESFQEESLDQSQNESAIDKFDIQPSLTFTSAGVNQSAASESGVYDEEGFEEDSAVAEPPSTISPSAANIINVRQEDPSSSLAHGSRSDENDGQSYFSEVLDTSRVDTPTVQTKWVSPPNTDTVQIDTQPSLNTSAFTVGETLQSENGVHEEEFVEDSIVVTPAPIGSIAAKDENVRQEDSSTARDTSSDVKKDSITPTSKLPDTSKGATMQETPESPPEAEFEEVTPSTYPRITIVRAYTLDEGKRVEMRDASTQFTGNHASIQTDLVPDGMHNLFAAAPAVTTPRRKDGVPPSEPAAQPPPPPVASTFGPPMYSLNAVQLPMTASTSTYKQQLLALQEQILQKKRETERIVQDRMSFQYTSLRGTERFLAARRTQKLELWEALIRVDPTLDEQKAREVARLAQAAST
ncbi:hypothetical protein PF005_g15521 [Phytophthora fragariae]|uniref:Uncharacterized protein n=1 Tax=Phytophthora fragariae TaxID=53985 RepID=A0A6A4D633_9STRA|nr:hypothetical protein PF009_g13380 [Phytophthora fragariae]KAE8999680.1 hypothetical protein PF011_g14528 [Phytophthora fragariae]KAE9099529.1 hypothetical protein PF007_g15844 [Phytophthora fragariae]KAE9099658.1 hypothetical protein PF010_g15115 [Phytophthora fragariae]KAE9135760.1 hypothetical protein PF006_g14528 [Phytophthora fragariae]